jgi:hypothetical protein
MILGQQTAPGGRLYAPIQGALGKVDGLAAFRAGVILVELVGEDLFAFTAFRALADKGFQGFKSLIAGAMLGCGHSILLFSIWDIVVVNHLHRWSG